MTNLAVAETEDKCHEDALQHNTITGRHTVTVGAYITGWIGVDVIFLIEKGLQALRTLFLFLLLSDCRKFPKALSIRNGS